MSSPVEYYDPQLKKSFVAKDDENNPLEFGRSSAIYSNSEAAAE